MHTRTSIHQQLCQYVDLGVINIHSLTTLDTTLHHQILGINVGCTEHGFPPPVQGEVRCHGTNPAVLFPIGG
jgi:hypothetical protein